MLFYSNDHKWPLSKPDIDEIALMFQHQYSKLCWTVTLIWYCIAHGEEQPKNMLELIKLCSFLAWQQLLCYFPTKWQQVVGYKWPKHFPLNLMEGNHRWLETAHNIWGHSVNRGSLLKSWCASVPVCFCQVTIYFLFPSKHFWLLSIS